MRDCVSFSRRTFFHVVILDILKEAEICFNFIIRDDHGFSPLHWSSKEGHTKIVDLLILRGARINATNRGDDTPLHLAAAHGHWDVVHMVSMKCYCQVGGNRKNWGAA